MNDLLILIAALLGVQLLVGVALVLMLWDYARRAINLLYDIRERASYVSGEHLPAIRGAVSDVVDHLLPPPGGGR